MVSSTEIRARARASLGGGVFQRSWLYGVAVLLIISLINSVAATFIVLPLIISGPLTVGSTHYFLNVSRKKEGAVGNFNVLLDAFKEDLGGKIILGLLYMLYLMLWSFLFVIPAIIKSYSYSMAYYIKCDHPEYTATQAINESRRMMDGHKMELFMLDLSFIGWLLLSLCCCGICAFWVSPYMQAARTEFYEELRRNDGGVSFAKNSENDGYQNEHFEFEKADPDRKKQENE